MNASNEGIQNSFEDQVKTTFSFLNREFQIFYLKTRYIEGDPRDSYIVSVFRNNNYKIEISWSEFELSLNVLIYSNKWEALSRLNRFVYLDSFVEFITNGKVACVIPQIYPKMSVPRIMNAADKRNEIFKEKSFTIILKELADKLHEYLPAIINQPIETIHEYHEWVNSGGKPLKNNLSTAVN